MTFSSTRHILSNIRLSVCWSILIGAFSFVIAADAQTCGTKLMSQSFSKYSSTTAYTASMMTADFPGVLGGPVHSSHCTVGAGQLTAEFPAGGLDSLDKFDLKESLGRCRPYRVIYSKLHTSNMSARAPMYCQPACTVHPRKVTAHRFPRLIRLKSMMLGDALKISCDCNLQHLFVLQCSVKARWMLFTPFTEFRGTPIMISDLI